MTVGMRIKQARTAAGLTRKRLAELSRVPYPTLAGLENGDQKGSTALPAIADALGVSATWLGTGRGPMNQSATENNSRDTLPRESQSGRLNHAIITQAKRWVQAEEVIAGPYPRDELVDQVLAVYELMLESGGVLSSGQRAARFSAAQVRAQHDGERDSRNKAG